jgi:hypothetical protein
VYLPLLLFLRHQRLRDASVVRNRNTATARAPNVLMAGGRSDAI